MDGQERSSGEHHVDIGMDLDSVFGDYDCVVGGEWSFVPCVGVFVLYYLCTGVGESCED